ncbi:MAG TPA: hypothetical protein PKD92_06605 [Novosphingobium sp.]|nr:hypothetical protein [Novosphingobium sp.]
MSDRLALSAALSVLMMSAFVLFSPASARDDLGPRVLTVDLPAPSISAALPGLR